MLYLRKCPYCDTTIEDGSKPCPKCGYVYDTGEMSNPAAAPAPSISNNTNNNDKDLGSLYKTMFMLSVFFIWPVSLIAGFVLVFSPYPKYRKFGKMILITLGAYIAFIVLFCVLLLG